MAKEEDRLTYMENISRDDLNEVIEVLKPLKEQTERVQAKNVGTASLPLVSLHTLLEKYKPKGDDLDLSKHLKARLSRELREVVKISDTHKIATFLDPPYRKLLMIPEERERIHALVSTLISGEDGDGDDPQPTDAEPPAAKKAKVDDYDMWKEDMDSAIENEV